MAVSDVVEGCFDSVVMVGSRVTCDPIPEDSDTDYLCLTYDHITLEEAISRVIRATGAVREGRHYVDLKGFVSLRIGAVNLVVTEDISFFNKFLEATLLAKRFNLLKKEDRIALFQLVLYGPAGDRWE